MSLSSPFIVFTWVLWLAPVAGVATSETPGAAAGVRRIELRDAGEPLPEIRIAPGLSTTVLFDSPIRPEEVVLEERERFQRLGLSEDHLVLIPSSTFWHGERMRLEVRFRDGATPERAALLLVVDASQVERQVELYRRPRTAESYRQEVEELKTVRVRLQQEVEQLRLGGTPAGGGDALFAALARWEDIEMVPVSYQRMVSSIPVTVQKIKKLKMEPGWCFLRVVLVQPGEPGAWTASGSSLQDEQGRPVKVLRPLAQQRLDEAAENLDVVLLIPIVDGAAFRAGRYTLKLWNEGAGQSMTFEGLKVP